MQIDVDLLLLIQDRKNELYKYYESPEYISHSGTNKGIVNLFITR